MRAMQDGLRSRRHMVCQPHQIFRLNLSVSISLLCRKADESERLPAERERQRESGLGIMPEVIHVVTAQFALRKYF